MNPDEIKKALDAIEAGDQAAAIEILKAMIASAASGGAAVSSEPAAEAAGAAAEVPPPSEEDKAAVAASRELMRITAAKTPGEAVAELERVFATVKTIEADRAALDLSARQELVAELVLAGVETPATAWADADKRAPKKRLMDEPIAELRERVKLIKASRPASASYRAPVDVESEAPKLSRAEIAACKRKGITEAEFVAAKAGAVVRNK